MSKREVSNQMVETDFSGDYLNIENAKEGDIIEVTGEGSYIEREFNGKLKQILTIPIKVNGKAKIYTPSISNGKQLVKAWGSDTKTWVGQEAKCIVIHYKSFGQTKQALEIVPL